MAGDKDAAFALFGGALCCGAILGQADAARRGSGDARSPSIGTVATRGISAAPDGLPNESATFIINIIHRQEDSLAVVAPAGIRGDTSRGAPGDWPAARLPGRCKRAGRRDARRRRRFARGGPGWPAPDYPQTTPPLDCLRHELASSAGRQRQSRAPAAIELAGKINSPRQQRTRLMGVSTRPVKTRATECRACEPPSESAGDDRRRILDMTTEAGRAEACQCAHRTGRHLLVRLAHCLEYVRGKLISGLLLAIILLD